MPQALATTTSTITVPILIYHTVRPHHAIESVLVGHYTVSPESFEWQLKYLAENGYHTITMEELVTMEINNIAPPARSVVLTFDDGWKSQYEYAFPLLKKYGDTGTFFIFTNGMNSKKKGFMTWDQVKEMAAAGMDFESHSISHPILSRITDSPTVWHEIADSKKIIETELGKTVEIFAYPFGTYNDLDIEMLKGAGYEAARTDLLKSNYQNTKDNLFTLEGGEITDNLKKFIQTTEQN